MFHEGDKVVLGVSGGADSVCLLFVLLELKDLLGITLHVVHVNHGVREDAAQDAAYVETLCREYNIPFMLEEIRLAELAQQLGATSEEAGRIARYGAFDRACREYGCSKIAVAHNSNDRAETMLFNLFRGTGLKGIAGIQPVRDNIVRPLLCLERKEIECYLEKRGILYKQDSTNETDDYTRNRIRHHVLPYAQENIAAASVANMNRAADIFAQEEAYLQEQTLKAGETCVTVHGKMDAPWKACAYTSEKGGSPSGDCACISGKENTSSGDCQQFEIDREQFLQQHPVIQKRLLLLLLKQLSPRQQDITAVHIEDIRSLFTKSGNRQINLPYGIRGERIYSRVRLARNAGVQQGAKCRCTGTAVVQQDTEYGYVGAVAAQHSTENRCTATNGAPDIAAAMAKNTDFCVTIFERKTDESDPEVRKKTITLPNGSEFIFTVFDKPQNMGENRLFLENRYTKWFDCDKILRTLKVRTRQTGDYLMIRGKEGPQHKKLKDYMVTEKIPREERDTIPLLAEEDHILWAVGYRISEYYKVTTGTTKILQVQFKP